MFKVNAVRSWNTNASELGDMVRFYRDVRGRTSFKNHEQRIVAAESQSK
jgi:hypothetical protein